MSLRAFLTVALAATATSGMSTGLKFRRQNSSAADGAKKLLLGGGPSGIVGAADFDGASFNIVANDSTLGTSASWMVFKEPNLLYAVEENSNDTRLFNVCLSPPSLGVSAADLVELVRPSHQRPEAGSERHRIVRGCLPRVQPGPDHPGWCCFRPGPG